jgi:hypothetical protein
MRFNMKKNIVIIGISLIFVMLFTYFSCDPPTGGNNNDSNNDADNVADPVVSYITDMSIDVPSVGQLTVDITTDTTGDTVKYKYEITASSIPSPAINNPKTGGTEYSAPFSVTVSGGNNTTRYFHIKVIASKTGLDDSTVVYSTKMCYTDGGGSTYWYWGKAKDPEISYSINNPSSGQTTVDITTDTTGATMTYKYEVTGSSSPSTDIDDPKTGGTDFTVPLVVNLNGGLDTTTYFHIKVIAYKTDWTDSNIVYSTKYCHVDSYGAVTWGP